MVGVNIAASIDRAGVRPLLTAQPKLHHECDWCSQRWARELARELGARRWRLTDRFRGVAGCLH